MRADQHLGHSSGNPGPGAHLIRGTKEGARNLAGAPGVPQGAPHTGGGVGGFDVEPELRFGVGRVQVEPGLAHDDSA
jgi:hypothetical protein